MNKIKFIKDYENSFMDTMFSNDFLSVIIPKDTVLEVNADGIYVFTYTLSSASINDTTESKSNDNKTECPSIEVTTYIAFDEDDVEKLISNGTVIRPITQEQYEKDLYNKAVKQNQQDCEIRERLDKLNEMYNTRLNQLQSRSDNDFYSKTDTDIRKYVCESIIDAIYYIKNGEQKIVKREGNI
jgi:hypothetical protein